MPSVVNSGICANASSVPIVVLANMQQEDLAKPRSLAISKHAIPKLAISKLAISKTDCALDNCRKVLDHSRRTGLPVGFIRMINDPAFFNRATPFVRLAEGFEPYYFEPYYFESCCFESYRNEMKFEWKSPSCYSGEPFTGIHAEVIETDNLIEPTLPRRLG